MINNITIKKKIQFSFTSNNSKCLNYYEIFFKKILIKLNISYKVVKFPIQKHIFSLLKSPHVYKKAQEHFFIKRYKIVFYINKIIFNKNFKIVLLLLKNKINNIKIKLKIS